MALQTLLGIGSLALVAGTYSAVAWIVATRFGPRSLFLTWFLGSLLLVSFYAVRLPRVLPTHAYALGVFAVILAFGLATRIVWRRMAHTAPSRVPTLAPIALATGAFLLGLLLGLLPLLLLDMLAIVG